MNVNAKPFILQCAIGHTSPPLNIENTREFPPLHQIPLSSATPVILVTSVAPAVVSDETDQFVFEKTLEKYESTPDPSAIPLLLSLMKKLGYPYHPLYRFCYPIFNIYLIHEGISDEDLYIDIPYIIRDEIEKEETDLNWPLFIKKLSICNYNFKYRDIYLEKVRNYKKLIDVQNLGFKDHRLNHAITTIQRLYRYGKIHPITDVTNYTEWYQTFEKRHHYHILEWKEHNIHTPTINQLDIPFDGGEKSALFWNRHLIPDYIIGYTCHRNTINYRQKFIPSDVEDMVDIKTLYENKKSRVTKMINGPITYDYIHKLHLILEYYTRNMLDLWRCRDVEVLKFIEIINSGYENITFKEGEPVYDDPFEKLMNLRLQTIIKILNVVNVCTANYGRTIFKTFSRLDISKVTTDDVRRWFTTMVIGDLSSYNKEIDTTLLIKFLNNSVDEDLVRNIHKVIDWCKNILIRYQNKLKKGELIYQHSLRYGNPPMIKNIKI